MSNGSNLAVKTGGTERPDLYSFLDIGIGELSQHPDILHGISDRKVDGLIIRNVLGQNDLADIKRRMADIPDHYIIRTPVGLTIPGTYTVAYEHWDNPDPDTSYFEKSQEFWSKARSIMSVDVNKRICDVFHSTGSGREVDIPINSKGEPYPAHTIRVLYPYRGGIQLHCENYLFSLFERASSELKSQLDYTRGLSYWLLVNLPDEGGKLKLYDLDWRDLKNDNHPLITRDAEGKIDLKNRDQLDYKHIQVNEGDMVIFAAGEIWHEITQIKGLKSRVTIGGFMGFSEDKVYHWS